MRQHSQLSPEHRCVNVPCSSVITVLPQTHSYLLNTMADTPRRDVRNHVLFEIATEVANRVGGIYSVLKSKAQVTTAEYGSNYIAFLQVANEFPPKGDKAQAQAQAQS